MTTIHYSYLRTQTQPWSLWQAAAAAARSGGGRDAQTKAKAEALAGLHAGATGEGLDTSGGAVGSGSKAGKPKWLKL